MTTTTALVPMGDLTAMAQAVCKSGLFSAVKSTDTAVSLMLLAQSEGLHPMQALRRYHIINGKPAMSAEAMLGGFQAAGGVVKWLAHSDERVAARFAAPGCPEGIEVDWDMRRAQTAGIKAKEMWAKYPRQMLRARVISEGVRATMPGVALGMYTPEEAVEFGNGKAVIDIEPDPLPTWAAPAPTPTPPPKKLAIEVVPPAPRYVVEEIGPTASDLIGEEGAARIVALLGEAMQRHDDSPEAKRAQARRWGDLLESAIGRRPARKAALASLTVGERDKVLAALAALTDAQEAANG